MDALSSTKPLRPNQNIQTHFPETADIETSSEEYANRFTGKVGKFFLDVQTAITLDLLKPWQKATILDVGGGHAQLAVPLVHRGFHVTVTGSSEECRNRLDRLMEAGSFRFQQSNILSLPFEDKCFDVVVAFRLLPHVRQWKNLIAEMCRVSRKAVLVDYPDILSFNIVSEYLFRAKKAIEGNTRPFTCFSREEITTEFLKHGFTHPVLRPELFVPMALHRAMNSATISKTLEYLSRVSGMTHLFGSPVILRVTSSA
jgi:2-polyprenyl-3-methyl-5-hydroxy-6-metoxy-1,4-benzoquinol methylase